MVLTQVSLLIYRQVDSNYDATATSNGQTVAYVDGAEGVFGTSEVMRLQVMVLVTFCMVVMVQMMLLVEQVRI